MYVPEKLGVKLYVLAVTVLRILCILLIPYRHTDRLGWQNLAQKCPDLGGVMDIHPCSGCRQFNISSHILMSYLFPETHLPISHLLLFKFFVLFQLM